MRLRKADVEKLLAGYDTDPIGALTVALRVVLEQSDATWDELVASAFTGARKASLECSDPVALDDLAAELNELRTLSSPGS